MSKRVFNHDAPSFFEAIGIKTLDNADAMAEAIISVMKILSSGKKSEGLEYLINTIDQDDTVAFLAYILDVGMQKSIEIAKGKDDE